MNHESIRYKLQKYENKMGVESNQYKRALYAEKVGHYRNLLQSGGSLSTIIAGHTKYFGTEVDEVMAEVTTKLNGFDPQSLIDSAGKIDTFIQGMGDNFKNVRKDLTESTIAFAEYNAAVRKRLTGLKSDVSKLPTAKIDQTTLDQINNAMNNPDVKDIASMNANADLIGEIGLLQGTSNAQNALRHITGYTDANDSTKNIVGVEPAFNKIKGILALFPETKVYAERVFRAVKALNDQNVNQAIDPLATNMGITL